MTQFSIFLKTRPYVEKVYSDVLFKNKELRFLSTVLQYISRLLLLDTSENKFLIGSLFLAKQEIS